VKLQFIWDHREYFPVRLMCRILETSPSGFHDWLRRPESRRIYGSPRVHASLKAKGYRIGRNRRHPVARWNLPAPVTRRVSCGSKIGGATGPL
jgi:hypothetical protein